VHEVVVREVVCPSGRGQRRCRSAICEKRGGRRRAGGGGGHIRR
jgi:hypothetical protein